jgi:serine/threonine protein kinase
MSYREKYLKYKNKYLNLKNQIGGTILIEDIKNFLYGEIFPEDNSEPMYQIKEEKLYKYFANKGTSRTNLDTILQLIICLLDKYHEDIIVSNTNTNAHFEIKHIITFVFEKIVIRIIPKNSLFEEVLRDLYSVLLNNECENLEHIYEIIDLDEYSVVVSKKLDTKYTIDELQTDEDKLFANVENGLDYLHQKHFIHNDPTLSNIGYDHDQQCYVLFDFDLTKRASIYDGDERILINSIVFNLSHYHKK